MNALQLKKANSASHLIRQLLLVMTALVCVFCFTSPSFAAGNGPPQVFNANGSLCDNPNYTGVTHRLVNCVRDIVWWSGSQFLIPFVTIMGKWMAAMATIAVICVGIMLATGNTHNLGRSGGVTLLKLGFTGMFFSQLGNNLTLILQMSDWMLTKSAIATFHVPIVCDQNNPNINDVWVRIDCIINSVTGIIDPNALKDGFVAFFVTAMFTNTWGFLLAIVGFSFLIMTMFSIAQAVFTYLMSVVAITFMFIVGVIFVPLVLVPAFKGYFEKWFRITLGLVIQPLIMFAFLGMMLIAFDSVVFTGPNALYTTVTGQPYQQGGESFGQFLGKCCYAMKARGGGAVAMANANLDNPKERDTAVVGAIEEFKDPGLFGDSSIPPVLALVAKNPIGNFSITVPVTAVDFKKLAKANGGGGGNLTAYMIKLIGATFSAFAVMYIMYGLLKIIPFIGTALSGEFLSMPNLAGLLSGRIEQVMQASAGASNILNKAGAAVGAKK